jgi:hypothetical protein
MADFDVRGSSSRWQGAMTLLFLSTPVRHLVTSETQKQMVLACVVAGIEAMTGGGGADPILNFEI